MLEHLKWDSNFFGLKIGRIVCDVRLDEKYLEFLLNDAKIANYALMYVLLLDNDVISDVFLSKNTGKLVDRKVIFRMNLNNTTVTPSDEIQDYTGKKLSTDLLDLVYLSGRFSRFKLDEYLPKDAFKRLYKVWIDKSLSGEMADKIFVSIVNNQVVGFVTLRINDNKGEIGLIAVSEQVQGRKIGTKLIDSCVNYLTQHSIAKLTVPTQLANIPACKFYENYGFEKSSVTDVYHFWL